MVIGFTQRMQSISESDGPEGANSFPLEIGVHSLRHSEIDYEVLFRVLSNSNATVEAVNLQFQIQFDAQFGITDSKQDPIVDSRFLLAGSLELASPLIVSIINDFNPEDLIKCFTIRIVSPDIVGDRDIFTCNEGFDAVDYFCLHTVCIFDDDGKFLYTPRLDNSYCVP